MNTMDEAPGAVLKSGLPFADAAAGVVLVHGRGATAQSILSISTELAVDGVAYAAPQAPGFTWYPHSFLAPLEANEPHLSNGIQTLRGVIRDMENAGIPADRIVLLGFSQGACLATETVARSPRRYGGVVALSGGLIGNGQIPDRQPPDDKQFLYEGSLEGTPVFVGCSDVDPHIPVSRVRKTGDVFRDLGGDVTVRIYPGMGHTINEDELEFARTLLGAITS